MQRQQFLHQQSYENLINISSTRQGNHAYAYNVKKELHMGSDGKTALDMIVMANIMARLLIQFAGRQGNSYVSMINSDSDLRDVRIASLLSRRIPTRIISRPDVDKRRLPMSQVTSLLQAIGLICQITQSLCINYSAVVLLPTHDIMHFASIWRTDIARYLAHSLFMLASSLKY